MPPSFAQNVVIGVYFSVLFSAYFGFGLFLNLKLKHYFFTEYALHAKTILIAILLEFLTIIFMFSEMVILKEKHEKLIILEYKQLLNSGTNNQFSIVYFALSILGENLPFLT